MRQWRKKRGCVLFSLLFELTILLCHRDYKFFFCCSLPFLSGYKYKQHYLYFVPYFEHLVKKTTTVLCDYAIVNSWNHLTPRMYVSSIVVTEKHYVSDGVEGWRGSPSLKHVHHLLARERVCFSSVVFSIDKNRYTYQHRWGLLSLLSLYVIYFSTFCSSLSTIRENLKTWQTALIVMFCWSNSKTRTKLQ